MPPRTELAVAVITASINRVPIAFINPLSCFIVVNSLSMLALLYADRVVWHAGITGSNRRGQTARDGITLPLETQAYLSSTRAFAEINRGFAAQGAAEIWWRSAWASWRSGVSNPSVNQL